MSPYQLVLQFRGDSLNEFDAMLAIEGKLAEVLTGTDFVDGHDMGCGEFNIFIHTPDPEMMFSCAKPV